MSFFEYKVIPAPSQRRWRQRSVDGMDKYASTIADLMTEMGLEGWDFIGAEALKERRRRYFVLICDIERTLMIFRRPAKVPDLSEGHGAAAEAKRAPDVVDPVIPRRVKRPDLVAQVAAGARRVQVNVVQRVEASDAFGAMDECRHGSEVSDANIVTAAEEVSDDTASAREEASMVETAGASARSDRSAKSTAPDRRATPEVDDELQGRAHKLERAVRRRREAATDPSGVAAE